MTAGYVAEAIWLLMHSRAGASLFNGGREENLDISALFIVKCAAHIKKSASELTLISPENIPLTPRASPGLYGAATDGFSFGGSL